MADIIAEIPVPGGILRVIESNCVTAYLNEKEITKERALELLGDARRALEKKAARKTGKKKAARKTGKQ